ncbi:exodeoxyribonuclease VII small subunit [Adlercreutzia mucosicola]|uniref:exodeoxyribonuclease VII small subunit n=1 Tax=Adlercreutzia mucosicola TaxID=580026 RepID=UPI000409A90F|nr:exodeoxyribonuclease VII small subunit [Adlercreutzia mucosicola]MCR2034747.1 exodeoxyribonuclease VII small subunit [Adlercreutzia mucosicola]
MEETIETTEGTLAPVDELTFRQALAELESIVAVLESNTLELEDSLASYERGVVLLGSLQKRLAAAEQQVEVLMGELAAAPDDETRDTTLS